MANDPLPLPDISAAPSSDNVHRADDLRGAHDADDAQNGEYEAIRTEIAATERGRWFLSEHVKRNRAGDADQLVGSLARAEAAMRGDAAAEIPGTLANDLAKLAAAIGQVEAVIAASVLPAAGGLAASERIQDVAFVLRERETDAALCDALEGALFELGDAFARHDTAAQRVQSAAALLRSLEASINAMIAFAATNPAGDSTSSVSADSPALVASGLDESLAVEPSPSDSAIDAPAMTEPVEAPAIAAEPAIHPRGVTPSMWETATAPDAEAMTNDLSAPQDAALGDAEAPKDAFANAEAPKDLVGGLHASTEIAGGRLSGEALADDALAPARSEAAVVSEVLPDAGSVPDEPPNSAATVARLVEESTIGPSVEEPTIELSTEESTIEPSVPIVAAAEAAEPAIELHADAADLAAKSPANDENVGIVKPPEDGSGLSAAGAAEATWSADDDIESLLEAASADPPPPAAQSAGAQEDLDDLFEPLPPEPDVQPVAVNAAQREPGPQMFSSELPAPVLSASATRTAASPAEPASLLIASAPAARTVPRPAPNDPLAALRALSKEELIALFS